MSRTQAARTRIEAVNDFVVKFANVNGSGSASANELFARSLLRMGVPVSPRNIFPSNIQGLPTWYEVRVTEKGWLGRRGGVDLMVAMNPQTWDQDVEEIEPGGYLFYDNTKPLPASKFRDDIHVVGMPLTEICATPPTPTRASASCSRTSSTSARSPACSGIEPEVIAELIGEQYKGKAKLLKPNLNALQLGLHHGREYFDDALGLEDRARATRSASRIFIEGNAAAALGCVYGGATVCAWYPITPSSSLAEALPEVLLEAARRQGDRQEQVRDRPGRGRDRLDRHRHRRRLERRARLHRHLRPGHLADDRVHRPGLLRRDPGHDHRRAARRPLDRHADAHPAGRPPRLRLRLARRHQARAAVPRGPARVLRVLGGGARPRRPAADADLRHDRPRHRHEPPPLRAARSGTTSGATTAAR